VNFSANPPLSPLLTPEELAVYVDTFKRTGFERPLLWYCTSRINWEESEKGNDGQVLPVTINVPTMMITAGKDYILKPELAANMEKWVPQLSRGNVQEAAHWVLQEQPEEVNALLIKWLNNVQAQRGEAGKL